MDLRDEIQRRRSFAIISHPDAGKSTLTEKLLVYGGALQIAGSTSDRSGSRASASDWMEMERKRGISISSTVLQFDYQGLRINLLDTPGHKDFSEDTYRVLMAVDAVVMVLDAAKGIESQTLKLFEICRLRGLPIMTFINKMDRPAREPLELLDEIEKSLQLHVHPMNWPLGMGEDFRGVFERHTRDVHLFERVPGGAYRAPVTVVDLQDDAVSSRLSPRTHRQAVEEIEILDQMILPFDLASVLEGHMTPVFFGSAVNNFGVQLLLDGFLALAPPPRPQVTLSGMLPPDDPRFSAFVFKIQSNMDPRHRDRIAFVRVCSGRFQRDMKVLHARTGDTVRLASTHKLFGRDRETVDEAFPGDVIGIVGHAEFRIGDTITEDREIIFRDIPRFPPEHFSYIHSADSSQFKRYRTGLDYLLQEGVVQTFSLDGRGSTTLLGAVGPLQFEVLQHRLESEFGARCRLEEAPWKVIRWVKAGSDDPAGVRLGTGTALGRDTHEGQVVLFPGAWDCQQFQEKNPKVLLSRLPGDRELLAPR